MRPLPHFGPFASWELKFPQLFFSRRGGFKLAIVTGHLTKFVCVYIYVSEKCRDCALASLRSL